MRALVSERDVTCWVEALTSDLSPMRVQRRLEHKASASEFGIIVSR